MVVDQFTDPGYKVLSQRIQQFPEIDDYIKAATLDSDDNEKVASTAFAWEDRRLFRIDTPAQAALSRVYMEKQAGIPRSVIAKCDKALEIFGVDLPLNEKVASVVEDESEYLLPGMKRFRVTSPEDVKLASEALIRNGKRMDVNTRTTASVNLAKLAVRYDTPIDSEILKMAGATMCDTKVLHDWIDARAVKSTDADIKVGYSKLAAHVRQLPPHCSDAEGLAKVATVLQTLDDGAGFQKYYGRTLLDPVVTVFNMDKVADDMMMLAGRQVPMEALLNLDPEVYNDTFGNDLAEEFVDSTGSIDPEQMKVILPTVPRDLQQALLAQMGV